MYEIYSNFFWKAILAHSAYSMWNVIIQKVKYV